MPAELAPESAFTALSGDTSRVGSGFHWACRLITSALTPLKAKGKGPTFSRAALETFGLVHERKSAINLRAKSAGFRNLRYTRIESTSADCSARLADYTDTEGVGVVQQTGIPGKVRNRDQDVPWMLTVTFRIGRRPTRSTTGTARPCESRGIFTHARAMITGVCWHHSVRKRIVLVPRRCCINDDLTNCV